MPLLSDLFEKHKLVRRQIVFWSQLVITFVIVMFFVKLDAIEPHHITAIVAFVGILEISLWFYLYARAQDNKLEVPAKPRHKALANKLKPDTEMKEGDD